jgi:hypothetical protein
VPPAPLREILCSSPSFTSSRPGRISSQSPSRDCSRSIRWNLSYGKGSVLQMSSLILNSFCPVFRPSAGTCPWGKEEIFNVVFNTVFPLCNVGFNCFPAVSAPCSGSSAGICLRGKEVFFQMSSLILFSSSFCPSFQINRWNLS